MAELTIIILSALLAITILVLVITLSRRDKRQFEENLRNQNVAEFQTIASQLLKTHTETLREDNTRQIDALLRPLAQHLSDFRKTVNDCYMQDNASRRSLADQIDRLMRMNETIGTEARNLTSALKGNNKVQGDWGEMILTTLLEQAGLEQGLHFEAQPTHDDQGSLLRGDDGQRQRPDIIVRLPQGKRVIIDSKVSLTAYAEACACDNEQERKSHLKEHVSSMRRHVDELASKKYQQTVKGSPDQVMMFVPNEGAYMAAVHTDSTLWQYAYTRNVAIVSPTHLFSMMQIISQLWVQDKQNRHTLEIARKGGMLYDKVMLFMQSLEDVGASLENAKKSFDTAMMRLATGKGNVAKLSKDLADLGVKASKNMPPLSRHIMETDTDTADESPSTGTK